MLVEWKSGLKHDDGINIELLNLLVELLIRNVEYSRRDVFKHNLELLRTVMELWKTNVQVPFQLLHDMMMVYNLIIQSSVSPGLKATPVELGTSERADPLRMPNVAFSKTSENLQPMDHGLQAWRKT